MLWEVDVTFNPAYLQVSIQRRQFVAVGVHLPGRVPQAPPHFILYFLPFPSVAEDFVHKPFVVVVKAKIIGLRL